MDRSSFQRAWRPVVVCALAIALALAAGSATAVGAESQGLPSGLSRLAAANGDAAVARGIATFDVVPTAIQTTALRSLGLQVQNMQNVPLAIVNGPVAALKAAVASGIASDVYPDE